MDSRISAMFEQADRALKQPGRNLSIHPFVEGVVNGTLSRDQVRVWAEQTYLYVEAVVPWIGVAYGNCDNPEARSHIWESLLEEATGQLSGTKPHPELMADFAEAMGSPRAKLSANEALPGTRAMLNHWELSLCHRHWTEGLAGMGYGGERQIPVTFRKVSDGLKKHYGVDDKARLFFEMHIKADEEHGDESQKVVAIGNPSDAGLKRVYNTILGTAEALWTCWMAYESVPART